jgi:hypothetical protein
MFELGVTELQSVVGLAHVVSSNLERDLVPLHFSDLLLAIERLAAEAAADSSKLAVGEFGRQFTSFSVETHEHLLLLVANAATNTDCRESQRGRLGVQRVAPCLRQCLEPRTRTLGLGATGHRTQLAIRERAVIVERGVVELRSLAGLAHDFSPSKFREDSSHMRRDRKYSARDMRKFVLGQCTRC